MIRVILFLFLLIDFGIHAQTGSRSAGFGAYSLASQDEYSVFNNPAAFVSDVGVYSVFAREDRFFVQKLALNNFGIFLPVHEKSAFGLQAFHTGFSAYSESRLSTSYATVLANKLRAGVRLNLHHYREPEIHGSAWTLSPDLFLWYGLSENFHLGIAIINFTGSNHPLGLDPISQEFRLGLESKLSTTTSLLFDLSQQSNLRVHSGVGVEWSPHSQLFLRTGFRLGIQQTHFGLGYRWKNNSFDLSYSYIPVLGMSPGISLILHFQNPE